MPRTSLVLAALSAFALLLPGLAKAQNAAPPPMDLLVQALFGAEDMATCMERVEAGFTRAGYVDVVADAGMGTVRGSAGSGDTAGIASMVACIPAGQFSIALASAGFSSLGDIGPQTQNNRLLGAINQM